MKDKIVSVDLLNKILQYLGNRPYIEVASLIAEIIKLESVSDEPRQLVKNK